MVKKARSIFEKYDKEIDKEKIKEQLKKSTFLDLYGGVGTFGINLADLFVKTIILESVGPSIECAKINIEKNNLKNTEAIVGDASRMNKVTNATGKNLFVVTDPPRSGMEQKAILHLLEMEPEVIIYVSCNPQQFAKELRAFSKKYDLISMTVFDMFPQTNHIETMAELRLKK